MTCTLTVNATATDHATLTTGAATDSKTVSQTITLTNISASRRQSLVSPHTTGGTGNDVLFGGSGNDVLTGGGGNDTYQFGHGGGQDRIVNGTAASTAPSGELDLGAGISANQLWFQRNGNDLSIAVMGSHDQITVGGWFSGAGAQLAGDQDGRRHEDRCRRVAAGPGDGGLFLRPWRLRSDNRDAGTQRWGLADHHCGQLARLSQGISQTNAAAAKTAAAFRVAATGARAPPLT